MSKRKEIKPIMPDVEWADIPGFSGYAATVDGRILSRMRGRWVSDEFWRYRVLNLDTDGYLCVWLRGQVYRVHRLVLLAFVGPCPDGMEGCHSNGKRDDARLENLRWDTHLGNHGDMIKHGTRRPMRGENNGMARLTTGDVLQIKRRLQGGETGAAIARAYPVSLHMISRIKRGLAWKHVQL